MRLEERSLEQETNAPQPHWSACLAMLVAWLVHLFDQIKKMKAVRRDTKFRADWKDGWPGLRQCEWLRDQLLAAAAAQLLAGKPVDLTGHDLILDPPDDYGGPCPQTPFEMNRRHLALAQWTANPEAWMLRHAQRIAKREGIDLDNPLAARGSTDALRAAHHEAVSVSKAQLPFTLMVSSDQRERPSNHEGEPRPKARDPPHVHGPPTPQISIAHSPLPQKRKLLRSRPLASLDTRIQNTCRPPMTDISARLAAVQFTLRMRGVAAPTQRAAISLV